MDEHRLFIIAFCSKMEARYEEHRAEKGDSWRGCDKQFLYDKLDEEYVEVFQTSPKDYDTLMSELVDLALVAAMCHARELYAKQGRDGSSRTDPSKDSGQQGSCTCEENGDDSELCPVHGKFDPDADPPHPDHSGPVGVDR